MSKDPVTYDHKTGYWIGPEIPWAGPKVLLVELPDPTPQAGWPSDDSCLNDESPAEAGPACAQCGAIHSGPCLPGRITQ